MGPELEYKMTYEELEAENESLMNTVLECAEDFRSMEEGYHEMVEIARAFLLYKETPDDFYAQAKDRFLEIYHVILKKEEVREHETI